MNIVQKNLFIVFMVGWLSYSGTYFLRKPLGVIKSDMEKELGFTKSQLGLLDTALLFPYALFQMILSSVGDIYGARKTYGICLFMAGVSMLTFGVWNSFLAFFTLLFLNGSFQSLCWPVVNKGLGAWVTDSQRNTIFGYFGTCPFFGGIVGTAVAVQLQLTYGWRSTFFVPSLFCMLMGILVLTFFLSPREKSIDVPGKEIQTVLKEAQALSMKELWRIRMVPEVSIAVFCLKTVRYALYMWLPMYLFQELNYSKSEAGLFSTMFEIGGIFGSACLGFVLRKFFQNKSLYGSCVQTFLSAIALVLFIITSHSGILINSLFMIAAGFLNCAPDIILVGSFPTELGEMDGRNAGAAIIGFVNGFGSIGTFLEGPLIGLISDAFGWSGMFYFMVLLSLVGALATYRAHRIYEVIKKAKSMTSSSSTSSSSSQSA